MSNSSSSSGGIGFAGLLTVVFITLKLVDKITWSWWWVLSPLWISVSIVIFILLIGLLIFILSNYWYDIIEFFKKVFRIETKKFKKIFRIGAKK